MCVNRTFSELNGDEISNGTYSVRFVMENGSPRFVVADIAINLGYKPNITYFWCRKYGLGKVVGKDNKLRTYATKEQAERIIADSMRVTADFIEFWQNEVIPQTDRKYAELQREVSEAQDKNRELVKIYEGLKEQNDELIGKIEALLKERSAISAILGLAS